MSVGSRHQEDSREPEKFGDYIFYCPRTILRMSDNGLPHYSARDFHCFSVIARAFPVRKAFGQ